MWRVTCTVLLLLLAYVFNALSQEPNYTAESCTMLVSKPYNHCVTYSTKMYKCCDAWCEDMSCFDLIYSKNCTAQHKLVTECCEGYNGTDCLPVCSDGNTCGRNEYCSNPNECSCLEGWTGSDCNIVSDIDVVDRYTNAVSLFWPLPPDTSNLVGYHVYIKDSPHNETINEVVNSTMIEGLQSFTSYTICVVPLLLSGTGAENCTDFKTKQKVPSTPPGDVITHNISDTAVVIEWDPPTQPNGDITSYTIYLISTVNRTIHVDGRFTLAYITELSAGQTIGIIISASNDAGEGMKSMYINYIAPTSGDTVNTADIDINAALSLPTQSNPWLTWLPPPSLDDVSFYVLILMEVSSNDEIGRWALRNDQRLEEMLNSLDDSTLYGMKVFFSTTSKQFDLLYSREFLTKQRIPSSYPNGISGSRLHETSINISWSTVPVTEAGGAVTKYTVRYSKGAESCGYTYDRVVRTVSSDDSNLVISGLAVSSNYCVSVSVSNMKGDGPFSPYVLVPVTSQSSYSVQIYGIPNCNQWKRNSSRIVELTNQLAAYLNNRCSDCIASDDYFVNRSLTCNDDGVTYSFIIIGTTAYSSSQLVQLLDNWRTLTEEVVVDGTYYYLEDNGGSSNTPVPCSVDNNRVPDFMIAIVVVLGIFLAIAIIAIVVLLIRCRTRHTVGPETICSDETDVGMEQFNGSKENMLT